MNAWLTLTILAAAGVALVAQNLLMVRITDAVSTVFITLVINSAVGLVLLTTVLLLRNGLGGVVEAAGAFRTWFILPGLLGSLFVFAGIVGYQKVGAATTIAVLVASQLVAGLIADSYKTNSGVSGISPLSLVGAVLLVSGAFLIASERV